MMANLKYWLKGLAVAALSMVVYAGALGCYIALMLLVISMEEGGDNLSAFSVSLTEAVVLLSQGNGFKTGSITLTIMPLLLTVLLIALIASLAKRVGTSLSGCVAGTIGWVLINVFFANSLDIKLVDTTGVVAVKTAIVFVLGYAIAAIPESPLTKRDLDWISEHVSSPVRKTVTIGVALGVLLITVYLVIGLIVVLYWAFSNQSAMVKLYELSGMQNGSRILTTIAMIAWIPNIAIWAISWVFGAGFSIGDLAEFTMWSGQGSALPSLPIFGLLPQAIETNWIRIALMCVPLALACAAGMVVMLFNKGFHIRVGNSDQQTDVKRVVLGFAYPAGAFCISCTVVSVCSSLLFAISSGALGSKHLAHIGVDVISSTRKIGQPTAVGLFSSWLLTLVAVSMFFGIRWIVKRVRESRSGASTAALESDNREVANAARTVTSTINNKEDQGDNNESTIRRALVSVFHKEGIEVLAEAFIKAGTEVVSTGSTAKRLAELGVKVTEVSEVTGFPECLDGRVKTLDPHIHAGILADMTNEDHAAQLEKFGIKPFDLVVVNLYPFADTVRSGADEAATIEKIDIGGPSMVRGAAKNSATVAIITDPNDYALVAARIENGEGFSLEERRWLAGKAFAHTAAYDATINEWTAKHWPKL